MKIFYRDTLNFLSYLTWKKLLNCAKLYSSFWFSRVLKKPIQWGLPMTISIEPTTACNLRCPECPSGLRSFTRPTGNLKKDFFTSIIDQIKDRLTYLIFYFQGEPFINPDFLKMVKHAHDNGIYTITSTNGHFLTRDNCDRIISSGLDRIIISVDGTTQETYQEYRKTGSLERVLIGAETLVQSKRDNGTSKPHIIFQFLVVKPNEHQIDDLYRLATSIGIDEVKLKTAQIYNYKNGNPLIPTIDLYSRYKKQKDGTYSIKNKLLNHCWKLWHACVITWDGNVVPCCFDKDASYPMGSLSNIRFEEIWKGSLYQRFRRQLFKGRDKIDICNNCTEGCKVWG